MKPYELEARLEGKWTGIGSGEFHSFDEASKALDDVAWPRNDLRIKPCDGLDMDKIVTCACGGKCYSHKKQTICNICGAIQ